MARRHEFRPGDWESAAVRVDEIISAHSGEDPFEEALKLLVAKLAHESSGAADLPFLGPPHKSAAREVNRLLAHASERWRGDQGLLVVKRLLRLDSATRTLRHDRRCGQAVNAWQWIKGPKRLQKPRENTEPASPGVGARPAI